MKPLRLALLVLAVLHGPCAGAAVGGEPLPAHCQSKDVSRLEIILPPLPDPPALDDDERGNVCPASIVTDALRSQRAISLRNVILKGRVDLTDIPQTSLYDLSDVFKDSRQRDRLRDRGWYRFGERVRAVTISIEIVGSRLEGITDRNVDPLVFLNSIDLSRTTFTGPVAFQGAVFLERLRLVASRFERPTTFASASFSTLLVVDSSFADVTFRSATAWDDVSFYRSTFGRARFDNSTFFGLEFACESCVFQDTASFADAKMFSRRANFRAAKFLKDVDFSGAQFHRDASFRHATFGGDASFVGAQFYSGADFASSAFTSAAATLSATEFRQPVWPALWQLSYDFSGAFFADRARTLAGAVFTANEALATTFLLAAFAGATGVALLRRRPLVKIRGTVLHVRYDFGDPTPPTTSPHRGMGDTAFLVGAYVVLLGALAWHYHRSAGVVVDEVSVSVVPALILFVWLAAVSTIGIAGFGYRTPWRYLADKWRARRPPPMGMEAPAERPTVTTDEATVENGAATEDGQAGAIPDTFGGLASYSSEFKPALHVRRPRADGALEAFAAAYKTGVLGIAGIRGSGKSAAARAFIDVRRSWSWPAFSLAAPTRYDEFSFLLSLFRRLCVNVQELVSDPTFFTNLPIFGQRTTTPTPFPGLAQATRELIILPPARTLAVYVLILLFVPPYVVYLLSAFPVPWDLVPAVTLGLVWAGLLVYFTRQVSVRLIRQARLRESAGGRLLLRTEELLDHLAYQRDLSEESESAVTLTQGFTARLKQGLVRHERALSLPELMEEYRDYVALLTRVYPGGLAVHIDELDKIEDVGGTRDFLNRIKGVFAVPGALYLVTVSDDVLESFRLRAVRGRDPVDSTFDDLVVIDPMNMDETLEMLCHRGFLTFDLAPPEPPTAGTFPPSAMAPASQRLTTEARARRLEIGILIAIASGGLPREILRLARRALTRSDGYETERFAETVWGDVIDTAETLVLGARDLSEELRLRVRGSLQGLRPFGGPGAGWSSIQRDVARRLASATPAQQAEWRGLDLLRESLEAMHAAFGELMAHQASIAEVARTIAAKHTFSGDDPSGAVNPSWPLLSVREHLPFAEALRVRFLSCR